MPTNIADFGHYQRLDVQNGLGEVALDACKGKRGTDTLNSIRQKTKEYPTKDSV